jgi:mercuric ion transport protein
MKEAIRPMPEESRRSRAGAWAALGAVAAAIGASLCCNGPLLFVTLGAGAGLASTFEPLRPLFTGLTALGLVIGFYVVYGRKPAAVPCGPGETCAIRRNGRRDRVVLWIATVLAVLFWSFNYWSTLLV